MSASLIIRRRRAMTVIYASMAALVTVGSMWRFVVSPDLGPWLLVFAIVVVAPCLLFLSARIRLDGGRLEVGLLGLRRTIEVRDMRAMRVEITVGSRAEKHHTLWLEGTGTLDRRLGIALGVYPVEEVGALVRALAKVVPGVRLDDGARQLSEGSYPHAA